MCNKKEKGFKMFKLILIAIVGAFFLGVIYMDNGSVSYDSQRGNEVFNQGKNFINEVSAKAEQDTETSNF